MMFGHFFSDWTFSAYEEGQLSESDLTRWNNMGLRMMEERKATLEARFGRFCSECGAVKFFVHSPEACAKDKVRIRGMIASGELERFLGADFVARVLSLRLK